MNTNSDIKKSKGRPRGPTKVGVYLRLEPDMVDYVKRLAKEKRGMGEDLIKQATGLEKSLGRREPEVKRESPVMVHVGADKMLSEYKNQNRMLLDDIQRLTEEVEFLKAELDGCRNLTYDEKMAYWKARALKAEAYAATKNE